MLRFFKDFIIYGVAAMLGKLAAIFLMPVYTNVLTKEEYGAMALITSCKGIIDLFSNMNIHSGIARDYYEVGIDRKRLVSTGLWSILSLSLTVMIIGLFTRNYLSDQLLGLSDVFCPAFTVMLCSIPAGSLMSYFAILTRFKKKPALYSLGIILQLLIQIGISVIGVVVVRAGIISVFYGVLAGELTAILYFAFLNKEYIKLQFDITLLRRALIFAIPTLPAILAGWLDSSMGQILIGKYVSVEDLGSYSIALSLASIFTLVSTAFNNVWSPFLYENYNTPGFKKGIKNLYTIIVLSLILISALLSLFSQEIVLLLSNEGYLDACQYVSLLCIPMSFYLLFPFASSGVSISRDTKYTGISYIVGSCGNLVCLFMTIRLWGVIAVPICLAVSRITTYIFLYKVSEKKIGYKLPNYLLGILIGIVLLCHIAIRMRLQLSVRIIMAVAIMSILIYMANNRFDFRGALRTMKSKHRENRF